MAIVKDFLNNKWETHCIGCSIGAKEMVPLGGLIRETRNFCLHQDPEIPIKAFLVITAQKHISSISELSHEESRELFDLVYETRNVLKKIDDITEITIVQEPIVYGLQRPANTL